MSEDYYCDFVLHGKVPVHVVAETDQVLAFHHVFRTWDTHIVVIPKTHIRSLAEIDGRLKISNGEDDHRGVFRGLQ